MTRAPRSRRLVLVGAVVVLGLSGCGSEGTTEPAGTGGSTPDTVVPTSAAADPPAVIVLAQPAAGTATASPMPHPAAPESAPADASTTDMKMFPTEVTYRFAGAPPELPGTATAWYFPADARATQEQVAALATAFGLTGDVTSLPQDQGAGWTVGSKDGSGPMLYVGTDAMQSWSFNGVVSPTVACVDPTAPDVGVAVEGAGEGELLLGDGGGRVAAPDPGTDTDLVGPVDATKTTESRPTESYPEMEVPPGEPIECMEAAPPANVPTKEEAEQLARDLFAQLGVDLSGYELESYADEWNAGVTAYLLLDGVRTTVSTYVGFGGDGQLSWAGGSLATPVRGDEYPLVGVPGGIERLNDQAARWSDRAVLEPGVELDPAADAEADAGTGAGAEPATSDAATDGIAVGEPASDQPPSIDAPVESVVVTFTDVRPSLELNWAADGTVWLLPGYQFTADDGGWYTVTAVEDQYLVEGDPAADPTVLEPAPTDPGASGEPGAAPDCAGAVTVDGFDPATLALDDVSFLVGLCTQDAAATAEGLGLTLRVARRDGEDLALTADYSETRVNVAVEDGIVTEIVSIG